jgi:hypothetical protein
MAQANGLTARILSGDQPPSRKSTACKRPVHRWFFVEVA